MKNLVQYINEGVIGTILQFTKLQGDVTNKYIEFAKNDKINALMNTEKYAKSVYSKFIKDTKAISFTEWWNTFGEQIKILTDTDNVSESIQDVRKAVGEITDIDRIYFHYLIFGFANTPEKSKKDYDDFTACLATRFPGRNCPSGWVYFVMLGDDTCCDGIPEPLGNEDGTPDYKEMWSLIHDKNFKII